MERGAGYDFRKAEEEEMKDTVAETTPVKELPPHFERLTDEYASIAVLEREINKPSHYVFTVPAYDVLDMLSECGFNMQDHYIASAIAYLARCKKKGQYLKDLKKAEFYIGRAIEEYENRHTPNNY